MKIVTILGTRPEIIKLSRIIPKLDKFSDHILVHTGQNYDERLNTLFFKDLSIRYPDYILNTKSESTLGMVGKILEQSEQLLKEIAPDKVLILGDTYSGLSAIVAKRLGIPIYHMEAGNRCYDDRVPEEVNRRIIDTTSDIQMPYTQRSREILLGEGYRPNKVFVIGNPINEVINHYTSSIEKSNILNELGIMDKKYFLLTIHRTETVNNQDRMLSVIKALENIIEKHQLPIVCSLHPHTEDRLKAYKIKLPKKIIVMPPMGFFDFVKLEKNCYCAISDSGTIQEEGAIFHIPQVLIRDATERYETIDAGSNYVTGIDADSITLAVDVVTSMRTDWPVAPEYQKDNVSDTVVRILLSKWETA